MKLMKTIRKALKLSQSEFGRKMNVTYNAIYNWEKGLNVPTLSSLLPLVKMIGIDSLYFFDLETDIQTDINKLIYISRNNCSIKDIKTGKPYLVSLTLDDETERSFYITAYNIEGTIKVKVKNDKGTWRFETLIYSSGNINMEILSKIIGLNDTHYFYDTENEPVREEKKMYEKAKLDTIRPIIKIETMFYKLDLIEKLVKARKEALDEA